MKLPILSVCPQYFFSQTQMDINYPGMNSDRSNGWPHTRQECQRRHTVEENRTENEANTTENLSFYGDELWKDLTLKIAVPVEDFFVSCRWQRGNDEINCSRYFELVMTFDGYCYELINYDESPETNDFTAHQAGVDFGLFLAIDIHQEEALIGSRSDGAGVTALLRERHTPINNVLHDFVSLSPGFEYNMAIDKHVTKRLPPPYSDVTCESAPGYTQSSCIEQCRWRAGYQGCSCWSDVSGVKNCTFCSQFTCHNRGDRTYYEGRCQCKPACEETTYQMSVTSLRFPSQLEEEKTIERYRHKYNVTGLRENAVSLRVYFNRMDHTVSAEKPALTATQVVSDLGGSLGLCLGASLITLFEFLECCAQSVSKCCRRCRIRNSRTYEAKY